MPAQKVSRKELLKSPDEFITTTARVLRWLKDNTRWVAAAAIAVIVVGAAIAGWGVYRDRREGQAQELEAQAYQLYRNATEQTDEASSKDLLAKAADRFREVIQEFDGTQAALMARIYRGYSTYALGRYDEAIRDYESALKAGPKEGMKVLALQGLGYALMAKGDLDHAIEVFRRLQQQGGVAFERTARWNIARCLEKQGKKKEALQIYKEIEQSFPDLVQRLLAQNRIQELSQPGGALP
jgi:predicted negative regulator of RcsB-dependent stress response